MSILWSPNEDKRLQCSLNDCTTDKRTDRFSVEARSEESPVAGVVDGVPGQRRVQ